jgi:hypothetical protein
MQKRQVAEAFPLSSFLSDEMAARGWTAKTCAPVAAYLRRGCGPS